MRKMKKKGFLLGMIAGVCLLGVGVYNKERGRCMVGYVLKLDVRVGGKADSGEGEKIVIWLNDNPVSVWNVSESGTLSMVINAWLRRGSNTCRITSQGKSSVRLYVTEWDVGKKESRMLVDREVRRGEEVRFLTKYEEAPVIFEKENELIGLPEEEVKKGVMDFVRRMCDDLKMHREGFYFERRKEAAGWLRKFSPFERDPFVEGEKINRRLFLDESVRVEVPDFERLRMIRGRNLVYVYQGEGKERERRGGEPYLLWYESKEGEGCIPPLVLARVRGEWIPWGF